jgi:hypothetical protein
MSQGTSKSWDAFIAHASEDKDAFVRPLAEALTRLGATIWYDEFSLRIGDSLSRSIDKGLADSRYGIVVISPRFIEKPWPEYELRGLTIRDVNEGRVILPIWYGVTPKEVAQFSPTLADKFALNTEALSLEDVALRLLLEIRPDIYSQHPRAELHRLASGADFRALQEELAHTREALREYRCPYCNARLSSRAGAPTDTSEKNWDIVESFDCGYQMFAGRVERPCPKDPQFPRFEDYELRFTETQDGWICRPSGKTNMARCVYLSKSIGRTREEAEQHVRQQYEFSRRILGQ